MGSEMAEFIGKRFGKLTVVSQAPKKHGKTAWHCVCDCGNELDVQQCALVTGNTKSCGCLKRKNIVGERFNHLTVLHRDNARGGSYWVCKCDCGKEISVDISNLRGGQKSCGCIRPDRPTWHHGYGTRIYGVWRGMIDRCYNPNSPNYPRYGALGIEVCEEWKSDFSSFREWAYANGYDDKAPRGVCTIERKNNGGNYEPSNCRWANMKEQGQNKRNTAFIFANGEKISMGDASEKYHIPIETLRRRINKGYTADDAVNIPVRKWVKHG